MIDYYTNYGHKKLNEVVLAGSHDAGITGGGSNVKTQKHDILAQAQAGVRVFDLRIAAESYTPTVGGAKEVSLRTYHSAILRDKNKPRIVSH